MTSCLVYFLKICASSSAGIRRSDSICVTTTPDSSRFWPLEGYAPGKSQPSFDKQFVRDWLKANPDSGYLLPDEVVVKTVDKYKEAYELLTGEKFA